MKKYRKGTLATLMVLALVFTLILPMSSLVSAGGGTLSVTIVECPGKCGWVVPVSHEFGIKAEIENTSDSVVPDASATITIADPAMAEIWPDGGSTHTWDLGDMGPRAVTTVAWTLHCLAPGDTTITVSTPYGPSASCEVNQLEEPELDLTITVPCEEATDCGNTYNVTVQLCNLGDVALTNAVIELSFDHELVMLDRVRTSTRISATLPLSVMIRMIA